ncbi:MAG: hypothetical protein IKP86_02280 [Anaerolineaceae bacterium]|nr:hypothetical protein [Anaerolineaceae bacterium]
MKEKRKSYRDRYFEDYQAVKVPADNKKGYKVDYRYTGFWVRYENSTQPLKNTKIRFAVLEVLSILIYVPAVLSGTPLSCARLANGFGTLQLVPWIAELIGVVRFLIASEYVKELSTIEIGATIRYGCLIRFFLAALSAFAGGIQILVQGKAVLPDLAVFLGIMISAVISLLIRKEYDHLLLIMYRNDNGKPGTRI